MKNQINKNIKKSSSACIYNKQRKSDCHTVMVTSFKTSKVNKGEIEYTNRSKHVKILSLQQNTSKSPF